MKNETAQMNDAEIWARWWHNVWARGMYHSTHTHTHLHDRSRARVCRCVRGANQNLKHSKRKLAHFAEGLMFDATCVWRHIVHGRIGLCGDFERRIAIFNTWYGINDMIHIIIPLSTCAQVNLSSLTQYRIAFTWLIAGIVYIVKRGDNDSGTIYLPIFISWK